MVIKVAGSKLNKRYLLALAFFAVALYVLLPQLGDFRSSSRLLRHPEASWTILAIGFTFLTYLSGAVTYCLLAFKSLNYGRTVLVQLAAMFVNRILPAGVGAIGVNYAYLRRMRHTAVQAGSVTVINNMFGGIGNGLLVMAALVFFSNSTASELGGQNRPWRLWLGMLAAAVLLAVILALSLGRRKFMGKLLEIRDQLLSYRNRPWRLAGALLSSMLLTSFNVLCLMCCALALGVNLPFTAILLILTFGVGIGTATPTPGGLGGFEAGLVAGFMAYQVDSPTALAVALLYRLISYWLPLLAGAPALVICQKRKLLLG